MCELLPNKRIGIAIPFHHILFPETAIQFPNRVAIPQNKQSLSSD
jgi:hypothetical protein